MSCNDQQHSSRSRFTLHSVRSTARTKVSVLGQSGKVLEYQPNVVPQTTWRQESDGLHIRAMRAQRLYNNREWPDPVVLKITDVQPAMTPPVVETGAAVWDSATHTATLSATLTALGKARSVEVGFQYQHLRGLDINERSESWHDTPLQEMTAPGKFSAEVKDWQPGEAYAFRAVVKHPLVTIHGDDVKVTAK